MADKISLHTSEKLSSMSSSVQSGVERGKLETWPVKSKGIVHSSRSPVSTSSNFVKPNIIPKPKFLEQLEGYLEKELRLLGCPPKGPHELRLQAHREVFELLIQDFKTYKPLLSAIKNEYDLFVAYQDELIRELLPMKTKLHFVEDENEKKLVELKSEERKEDKLLRQRCKELDEQAIQMKNDHLSFRRQIDRLQEELAITYEKYRNEADARKLLISDINELKAKQDEQREEESCSAVQLDDPVILKLKLTRTREDLKGANMRINQMMADYGDVVPRREFEMLQTSYTTLETEAESIKTQYATIIEEHNTLMVMYKDLQGQRDRSMKELARMKGTATPRPDWSRCGEFIEGGPEKWAEITEGRSSDELVDILCAQIAGVDISELTRHGTFKGQGLSTDVPRYLRTETQVPNRRMGRREMEEMISGFWEYRSMKMAELQDQTHSVDSLLHEYLLSRNDGNEETAIEDGYNLQDCCSRFVHLIHINVFMGILSGEIEEEVYIGWISTQVALMQIFKSSMGSEETLSVNSFEEALRRVLLYKEEPFLKGLLQCAVRKAKEGENINIVKLMDKGPSSDPSEFVCLILEQRREETRQYTNKILKHLGDKDVATLEGVMKAVKMLDPHRDDPEIHLMMSKFFMTPLGQLNESGALKMPLQDLVKKLEATNYVKTLN